MFPSVTLNGPFTVTVNGGTFTYSSTSILPLELLHFSGKHQGDNNLLEWETALESNVSGIQVERSSDGVQFKVIGEETPGNAKDNHYTYADTRPLPGNNYYRLGFVDMDGSKTYSKIILIKHQDLPALSLYPNPASNVIQVTSATDGIITIYNSAGGLVIKQPVAKGISRINIQALPAGIYVCKINGQQSQFIKK